MPVRIDLSARTIAVSPGALLADASRRVGWDRSDGLERRWIGQAVHRRVLSEAMRTIPGYASERGVKLVFPVGDFTATLEGRLDGRYEEDGRVVVDEVKSLHFAEDLPRLAGSPRLARFTRQLQWYLLAVAETENREVGGRLVLADIETGATRIQPVAFDPLEARADLVARVHALLEAFLEGQALAEAKAAEAQTLAFPFGTYRPGQREMTAAVARAAREGEHLLVEAPTGIGKTAASLFPLLVEALRRGRRLYVLTAKTTQQEMFRATLARIAGDAFRSLRLRAKERMCANDVVLCHEDHCRFAKDYGAKLEADGLVERLLALDRHLEPDRVFEEARNAVVCPFEVSLELAAEADVVIGDYNYVFDPVVALSGARDPESLAEAYLLVDEAHNLVDRGRGYYSPELAEAELRELQRGLGVLRGSTAIDAAAALEDVLDLVRKAAATLDSEDEEAVELLDLDPDSLDELRFRTEALLVRHLADLRAGGERVPDDPIVAFCFLVFRFHDVLRLAAPGGRPQPAFDVLAARGPAGARLAILCKDPSGLLGPILNGSAGVLAMSATLSPPELHRDLLGLDPERTSVLRLPSPFPRENRLIRIARSVDTTWATRASEAPKIARLVAGVAEATPGNVLALFPSYRYLDEVRRALPPLPGRRVLRPPDRSTELERGAALAAMRDGGTPVLLLAVSGGAFAEGVDYPGEMLRAVVVVSPALPAVRFEQERLKLYYDERFEKGFEYGYVVPGMTRVVQSAGRLIRSEEDTGAVVLACRRFLRSPYRRYLPSDWYGETAEELGSEDAADDVRRFFADLAARAVPTR